MLFIFLITFFCVNIAFRAKVRGLRPMPWVLSTILAVFAGVFVAAIVISITWISRYGMLSQEKMMEMVNSGEIKLTVWNDWFVLVCAFGGYLLIRYLVDKRGKQTKRDQE